MKKEKIELQWIEKGAKKDKRRVSLKAELVDGKLNLAKPMCLPSIICIAARLLVAIRPVLSWLNV